jgi:uncharacterized protein
VVDLPPAAAWRHAGAREGFEVAFFRPVAGGWRVEGHAAAVEEGRPWAVRYAIELGPDGVTRSARVAGRTGAGEREVRLERAPDGAWRVDGQLAPRLAGCFDVDLEASAFTNALPVRRLRLGVGEQADAPAAYLRALDLRVERLAQRYVRLEDGGERLRYAYAAPELGFVAELAYDRAGLVLDYPGLATRSL